MCPYSSHKSFESAKLGLLVPTISCKDIGIFDVNVTTKRTSC